MDTTAGTGIGRPDTFEAIEAGVERAGWPIRRNRGGGFDVSTKICHGGDSPFKLGIFPRDDGGFSAKCRTAGCQGRELYDSIRREAQVTASPMVASPVGAGDARPTTRSVPSEGTSRPASNYWSKRLCTKSPG